LLCAGKRLHVRYVCTVVVLSTQPCPQVKAPAACQGALTQPLPIRHISRLPRRASPVLQALQLRQVDAVPHQHVRVLAKLPGSDGAPVGRHG
jgi:hypothetical protein